MKTKDRQIGWHLFLVVVVFLLLMPIVFATVSYTHLTLPTKA